MEKKLYKVFKPGYPVREWLSLWEVACYRNKGYKVDRIENYLK